jgi:hypothetical protein
MEYRYILSKITMKDAREEEKRMCPLLSENDRAGLNVMVWKRGQVSKRGKMSHRNNMTQKQYVTVWEEGWHETDGKNVSGNILSQSR